MRVLRQLLFACLVVGTTGIASAQPLSSEPLHLHRKLICPLLHAKAMPKNMPGDAMVFTGPAGDGRRGSAGFIVPTGEHVADGSSRWSFTFQRAPSGYGVQIVHPLGKGHVLINVSSEVTIHRGGVWGEIGWGAPATSDKVELAKDASRVLPLKTETPLEFVSQLSSGGQYSLRINDVVVCRHAIPRADRLVLEIPPNTPVWGGSGWDETSFVGPDFESKLRPGAGGIILSPMDGSGPTHHVKEVRLAMAQPEPAELATSNSVLVATRDNICAALLSRVTSHRAAGRIHRSPRVGGHSGGAYEALPHDASILTGFELSTSTFYGGHHTIKSIRPIFQTLEGEVVGEWNGHPHGRIHRIVARHGYAVAGIVARSGHRIDGLRVIFMSLVHGRLNPDDTYRSDWVGGRGGGPETIIGTNGLPVVGIYGKRGADVDSLGLIQAGHLPFSQSARSLNALLPHLAGSWEFKYTNNTSHIRTIEKNQSVNERDEIVQQGNDILIVFPDVIERITPAGDRVFVEHFNPRSTYPDGPPAVLGVGHKLK